jgi:tetratricopeptide (TPR) repeat protein
MAMEHLGHISADSSRRGDAELVVGQALWSAYLADSRLPEGQQPTKTTMDKTISQAQKTLEDGVQRLRKAVDAGGEVSYALEVAVLALAQICLEQGQGDKAVAWLDDPKIGPNTLAKTNHKATDRGNFRVETFKAALRACVATQDLKKAEETMTALEKIGGTAKVAGIYVGLGQQLEASMKRLRAEGHPEEAAKASRGFELLLTRISTRPAKEITFNSILWVAETFVNLGMSLDSGNGPPSKEALEYYQKATEVYRKILELCRADEKFAEI